MLIILDIISTRREAKISASIKCVGNISKCVTNSRIVHLEVRLCVPSGVEECGQPSV